MHRPERSDPDRPREVTRHIRGSVANLLWGRAAGRCEFDGCNKALWKSSVTQETLNLAEKAHIYSFSAAGPRGHEGISPAELNAIENLMLVCPECHSKIDLEKDGGRYTASLLMNWKVSHERRIERVTEIARDKGSHVLLYGANIGAHSGPLVYREAAEAMFPYRFPAEDRPIPLGMLNSASTESDGVNFWKREAENLSSHYRRLVGERIRSGEISHLSVFAIAPQPLLILLGTLLCDIVPSDVYQRHREPEPSWSWPATASPALFEVRRPQRTEGPPAIALALSATITSDRITSILGGEVSIWTVTVAAPSKELVKSAGQLAQMRGHLRSLFDEIKASHGQTQTLHVFPAMPVSLAVEFGRARSPKADMPWRIYDQVNSQGGFVHAVDIDLE